MKEWLALALARSLGRTEDIILLDTVRIELREYANVWFFLPHVVDMLLDAKDYLFRPVAVLGLMLNLYTTGRYSIPPIQR